jgi:hypothetical protein
MTSRAVDNQVFFAACSPARDLTAEYHAVSTLFENFCSLAKSSLSVGSLNGRRPDVRHHHFGDVAYLI